MFSFLKMKRFCLWRCSALFVVVFPLASAQAANHTAADNTHIMPLNPSAQYVSQSKAHALNKRKDKNKKDISHQGHYIGLVSFNSDQGEVVEGISINFYKNGTLTYATDEEAGPSDMETVAQGVWEQEGKHIRFGATGFRANESFCNALASNQPPIYPTCKLVVYFEGEVVEGHLTGTAKVGAASSVTNDPNLFVIEVSFDLKKQTIEDYRDRFTP